MKFIFGLLLLLSGCSSYNQAQVGSCYVGIKNNEESAKIDSIEIINDRYIHYIFIDNSVSIPYSNKATTLEIDFLNYYTKSSCEIYEKELLKFKLFKLELRIDVLTNTIKELEKTK